MEAGTMTASRAARALERYNDRMGHNGLAGNWEWGSGERSHEHVSDGGYYDKWAYRTLPGSNQHVERYLACHIYGEKGRHALEIREMREDDVEAREVELHESRTFYPDSARKNDEDEHRRLENKAQRCAVRLMAEYADYEP